MAAFWESSSSPCVIQVLHQRVVHPGVVYDSLVARGVEFMFGPFWQLFSSFKSVESFFAYAFESQNLHQDHIFYEDLSNR